MPNTVIANVYRGLNNSGLPDLIPTGSPIRVFWSNLLTKTSSPPTGEDPINLILEMLISTGQVPANWSGGTNTNYDVFELGVGLGIPEDQIDLQSFTDIRAQLDYDPKLALAFAFLQPVPAKDFIEQELCKPFGFYLSTGTDGRIRCVRPRHPQKFYIGGVNMALGQNLYGPASDPLLLPVGVFTGDEIAALVTSEFKRIPNATIPDPFCTYDHGTNRFSMPGQVQIGSNLNPVPLVLQRRAAIGSAWPTLGFPTLPTVGVTSGPLVSQPVGQLSQAIKDRTLTKDDMWGVQTLDNRADQITSVVYEHDYNFDTGVFQQRRHYFDPQAYGFNGSLGPFEYRIQSRGVGITWLSGPTDLPQTQSWTGAFAPPSSGCDPIATRQLVTTPTGSTPGGGVVVVGGQIVLADADAWAQLVAFSLMDRYRQPPLKFRAHLKWKWNSLQVGDVVRVNYTIPGVFADFEMNASTLANRLFEIVELHPNFDGSVDATFLGHRYVSY